MRRSAAFIALATGLGTAAAVGALPARAAGLETLFVRTGGTGSACTATDPCASVQQAVDQAATYPGPVIIDIGRGTFSPTATSAGVLVGDGAAPDQEASLTFRGAGAGATVLTTPSVGNNFMGTPFRAGILVTDENGGPIHPVTVTDLTIAGSPAPSNDASLNAGILDFASGSLSVADVVIRDLTGGSGGDGSAANTVLGGGVGEGAALGVAHVPVDSSLPVGLTSVTRTVITRLTAGDAGAGLVDHSSDTNPAANGGGTGGGAVGVLGQQVTVRASRISALHAGRGGDGVDSTDSAFFGGPGGIGGTAAGVAATFGGRATVADSAVRDLTTGAGGNGGAGDSSPGGQGGTGGTAAGVVAAAINMAVTRSEFAGYTTDRGGHGGQGGTTTTGGQGGAGGSVVGVLGEQLSFDASSAAPIESAHIADITVTGLHATAGGDGGAGATAADGGSGGARPQITVGILFAGVSINPPYPVPPSIIVIGPGPGPTATPSNPAAQEPTVTHVTITNLSDDGPGSGTGTGSSFLALAGSVAVLAQTTPVDLQLTASLLNAGGEPDCATFGSYPAVTDPDPTAPPQPVPAAITDAGYNVTSDDTCGAGPGSFTMTPAQFAASLGRLADNGGVVRLGPSGFRPAHTRTLALSGRSPAASAVAAIRGLCARPDQIGQARPGQGAPNSCAAGAYEPEQLSCGVLSPSQRCEAGAGRD